MNLKKTTVAVFLSYLLFASHLLRAQTQLSFDELTGSRTSNLVKEQLHQEKSISNETLRLNQAANSTCLLQAYSFHWFFIRIISYQDTSYIPCDINQYLKLTPNSVMAQMRTLPNAPYFVNLPGIHFGTMDVVKTGLGLDYINIGTIRFFPIAISEISFGEILLSLFRRNQGIEYGRAYTPVNTRENVYMRWNPGNTVIFLTSPKGKTYVMTSYTSLLIPSLNRSNLTELGKFMNLPEGWTYDSKTLKKVLEVHSKQAQGLKTMRLVDEYENIYIEVNAKTLSEL